jgi:histidinol-phosphate/aromatic aminotransferase/cobyric acid decarboxylase-like protein
MDSFQKDDFFEVNRKYFNEIFDDERDYLHPSGFLNTDISTIEKFQNITIDKNNFVEYHNDSTSNIIQYKSVIQNLFSHWDSYNYNTNELTICHSVTIGSIVVLDYLYKNNVKDIIFETPAYYATIIQAEQMNFNITKIPSYYNNGFINSLQIKKKKPIVYWITQPRISLGTNQDIKYIENIINSLKDIDYLVIDEATELMFPSHLSFTTTYKNKNIIKIRSIFKGMGLNGARISTIVHPQHMKKDLNLSLWIYQGGLDIFSLELVKKTCHIDYFKTILNTSLNQVLETKRILKKHLLGSNIELSNIQSGYIGTLIFNYNNDENNSENRKLLLSLLSEHRIVVTLGASMNFAFDKKREYIRLNYYINQEHLIKSINIMKTFEKYF